MLHTEDVIERATICPALAVLVPHAWKIVGDDRPATLAEGANRPRLGIGKAKAGRQNEHTIFRGDAVLDDVRVAEKVVLETGVAQHVLPGAPNERGTAQPFIGVTIAPGFSVRLGVENPAELNGGMIVVDRDAIVFPFRAGHQRPNLLARLEIGWSGLGRATAKRRGAIEPLSLPPSRYGRGSHGRGGILQVCQIVSSADL